MFILFFSVVIVLLSIPIHLCEVLSIEIGSYLAQSSVFENLAEYPPIPVETGVLLNKHHLLPEAADLTALRAGLNELFFNKICSYYGD